MNSPEQCLPTFDRSTALYRVWSRLTARLAAPAVVTRIYREHLTYLSRLALAELHRGAGEVERDAVPGVMIEVGCALGGSALVIATAKAAGRRFEIYDIFGMPPGPSAGDGPDVHARYEEIASGRSEGIGGEPYYGYVDDLLGKVRTAFDRHGFGNDGSIRFVPGRIQQTLAPVGPVAFAHIDCDRYDSVKTSLQAIMPRLAVGGAVFVDDYFSKSGCKRAVDEFFGGRRGYRLIHRSQLQIRHA